MTTAIAFPFFWLIVSIYSTTGQGFTDARKKKTIQQYKKLVRKEERKEGHLRTHPASSNRGELPIGGEDAHNTSRRVEKGKQNKHRDMLVTPLFQHFDIFFVAIFLGYLLLSIIKLSKVSELTNQYWLL